MTLCPVVMPVSGDVQRLPGRNKVAALSDCARQALRLSAAKSGIVLGELQKDSDDVPLPFGEYHWSVSHKPRYVAAVVGRGRMGIDVEAIEPRKEEIFGYVAGEDEWGLFGGKSWDSLYRCWTAKEAVLKAVGVGFKGLSGCRIRRLLNAKHLEVDYRGERFLIEHFYFNGHIASVVQNRFRVQWEIQA